MIRITTIILLIVLMVLIFKWLYHAIQYTKTKENSKVRGFIVEHHYQLMNLYGLLSVIDLIFLSFAVSAGN